MLLQTSSKTEKRRTLVLLAMCFATGLVSMPVRPGVVLGESMAPTFHSGQVFLTTRVRHPEALQRGDVVLVGVGGQVFLKRIGAVGGDRLFVLRTSDEGWGAERIIPSGEIGKVQRLVGRYRGLGDLVQFSVPEGHVYVLGDSRSNSYDSRHFGSVPWGAIRGRVVLGPIFQLWGEEGGGAQVAMAGEIGGR